MICEKYLDDWMKFIYGKDYKNRDVRQSEKHTMDILHIVYKPRFKHFRPPMWKIFMWAYKVEKKTLFKNCYPSAMSTSSDESKEVNVTFKCNPIRNENIDKVVDHLKEVYKNVGN